MTAENFHIDYHCINGEDYKENRKKKTHGEDIDLHPTFYRYSTRSGFTK